MSDDSWLEVLKRVSTSEPIDLDRLIFERDGPETSTSAQGEFPNRGAYSPTPSLALWNLDQDENARLGVRVNAPLPDATQAACRLAAAALEKGISPIIFSTLPVSGLERFGFRVERVMGDTSEERAACEEQLKKFWNVAIVIDAFDIVSLS